MLLFLYEYIRDERLDYWESFDAKLRFLFMYLFLTRAGSGNQFISAYLESWLYYTTIVSRSLCFNCFWEWFFRNVMKSSRFFWEWCWWYGFLIFCYCFRSCSILRSLFLFISIEIILCLMFSLLRCIGSSSWSSLA